MANILEKLKAYGFYILLGLNVTAMTIGAYMSLSSMKTTLDLLTVTKDMSIEEYLVYRKVFENKPILYTFKPFAVNLPNDDDDTAIQLEINLEMMTAVGYEELVTKKDFVRDTVVRVLSEKTLPDLSSIQGKLFLKDDIAEAVNLELEKGFVKGVYFTQFKFSKQ